MPLLIDPADIEKVKRSADLAAIVRAHGVELKRQGRQLAGRCPFHSPDKTPSFFVDPVARKWKCLGACAAKGSESSGGDVFRFLMLIENLSFIEAVEKAGGTIERGPLPAPRTKRTNGNGDLALLGRVVDFYHRTLLATPRAIEYLAKRGITNVDLVKAYRIGCADGSLIEKATGPLCDTLIRLGVFVGSNRELLHGCIVFPLLDASGVVVNLYGRAIDRDQHLYLPGKRRGLFNAAILRGAGEVILTESVIDALSAIEAGVMNVLPLYGANGFTPDHETLLREIKPKGIALALDSDEAGRAATARLAQQLAPDFDVRGIELARKDLNEVLVLDGADALRSALAKTEARIASPNSPEPPQAAKEESPQITVNGSEMQFARGQSLFTVRGIDAKRGSSLRVGLKLSLGERRVIDTVDLISARSRNGFLSRAVEAGLGDRAGIERGLDLLIEQIDKLQRERDAPPPPRKLEMSAAEREEAMTLYLRPDLLDVAASDMDLLGYVGETTNKQLGLLVAVSRKLDAPLSMVIMSQSGSGKSALADVLEQLTPPEEVHVFSRLSAQALYWMERDALQHRFLIIEERAGSADADYSIRSLQSKKKLVLAVPIKDPSSGRIRTMIFEVLGPAAFLETTTERWIHPENATRCFEMWCDESEGQTRRIHEAQRRGKTLAGRRAYASREAIIRRHQNGQRLLERVAVVIPYAELIDFPFQWLRTRRDNLRFLNLIEAIAFLYQFQRERKTDVDGSIYIEATTDDYARAYALARDVLGQTLADVKKPAAEFYASVRTLAANKGDGSLTRREIREATGLPDHRVIALLSELVALEYLEIVSGANGKTFRYRLTSGPAPAAGALAGLTTPEELRARIEANENNLADGSKRFSQGGQPVETKERKRC